MAISTQAVDELIPSIFNDIESKREIINSFRSRFANKSTEDIITLRAFEFFDLIDEFEISISQALQAMQTLQTEIWNLKEKAQTNPLSSPYMFNSSINNDSSKLFFDYSQVKGYSQLINDNTDDNIIEIKKGLLCDNIEKEEEKEKESFHIQETENTNVVNETHLNTKIPIRQSIRQMLKSSKKNTIETERKSDSQEEKIKNLLTKIGNVETYRIYFADKYGNGNYDEFIHKLNNGKISKNVLMDELNIISDLMTKQLNSKEHKKNNKLVVGGKKTHTFSNYKPNQYIEPVNFSSYLRNGDDNKTKNIKKRNMSFSKEKIYK